MLPPLIFIIVLACLFVSANEGKGLSSDTFADAIRQAEELNQETNKLIHQNLLARLQEPGSKKGCSSPLIHGVDGTSKGCVKDTAPHFSSTEKTERIMIFVSFSMPDASLKALAQDAKKHNAVLVMRGLYQDSFVKTASRLQELGITVDVHPELFETHHVTSVPTFVKLKDGQPTYSLKGNVTLGFAMKVFEEEGQQAKEMCCKEAP